jgi:hypothetical protein
VYCGLFSRSCLETIVHDSGGRKSISNTPSVRLDFVFQINNHIPKSKMPPINVPQLQGTVLIIECCGRKNDRSTIVAFALRSWFS